jgi:F420-dependent oxidoreductase-like protein
VRLRHGAQVKANKIHHAAGSDILVPPNGDGTRRFPVRFGLQVSQFDTPGGAAQVGPLFLDLARRADAAGLHSLWVMDHFFQIPEVGPAEHFMLEGYTALGAAAAVTSRITLGTMVTGVTYRHPGILVKTVTTLDVLSGGRAWLGLGAGWFEREHLALGVPFVPAGVRFERLEETLQIATQMWSDDCGPYIGKHHQLMETLCQPLPVSRPRPRILIGGGGERKTLRLAAQYADTWNMFAMDASEVAPKIDILHAHCDAIGRPFGEIEKSVLGPPILPEGQTGLYGFSPAQGIDFVGRLRELGIQHYVSFISVNQGVAVDVLASEIMPHFSEEPASV